MNKFYKLLFFIPMIIVGCKGPDLSNKNFNQVFNKFDLTIYSTEGNKMLTIKSPNSNYDGVKNIFNLKETTIFLFKGNIKEYIITLLIFCFHFVFHRFKEFNYIIRLIHYCFI